MYHENFSGSHYNAGARFGAALKKRAGTAAELAAYPVTAEMREFAAACIPLYRKHFPEILDEIAGMAAGQGVPDSELAGFLLPMYCFRQDQRCTAFAVSDGEQVLLGKNSDFLVCLEVLYLNCLYRLEGANAFNANTTAFIEMEDGMNEQGLAAALTSVFPHIRRPGLNAGMLVRFLLEKCSTTGEALPCLERLPIASCHTITLADQSGDIAVAECTPDRVEVLRPGPGRPFALAVNEFGSPALRGWRTPPEVDSWRSEERRQTVTAALRACEGGFSLPFVQDVLAGKYGFVCQYDRKSGADTVWSAVYDPKQGRIWRAEGNPARRPFEEDRR